LTDKSPEWHHLPSNPYNPHAWIVGEPEIGSGCWIGAFTVIDGSGGLTIGKGCDVSAGAQIYTHSTVARVVSERAAAISKARVTIGDHVHIGAGAIVLMGCSIGHHAVIGAGAVLPEFSNIPPWSVAIGVPARIVPDGARKWLRVPDSGIDAVDTSHGRVL
jgi:acetyltransferase-like isoleucine patch superfamily enzyme